MTEYSGNSKRAREEQQKPKVEDKQIEKVVTGEVVVQKRGLGRKIKDLFVAADFKSVVGYVMYDVMIPAARNLIVESATKGVERMMFGEAASSRHRSIYGPGPRVTYNRPVQRGGSPLMPQGGRPQLPRNTSRRTEDDIILVDRGEAELVLERLNDIIDTYQVASVADLKDLLGIVADHTDHKWGWVGLAGSRIHQVREGYLLDLPPADPINSI